MIAVAVETGDPGHSAHLAGTAAPRDKHHHIHRLGNQGTRWRDGNFQDQLLKTKQCTLSGTGMHGGDAAGMACL